MNNHRIIDEVAYGIALSRIAPAENLRCLGRDFRAPKPPAEVATFQRWKKTLDVLSDAPLTLKEVADLTGQNLDTTRKYLTRMRSMDLARNGERRAMPQGGFSHTWIKGAKA